MPTPRKPVPIELVKQLHAQCVSYSEIGYRLGMSQGHIGATMRKHGYAPGKDHTVRAQKRFPTQEAVRLYNEGLSTRQIATKLKYVKSTVHKQLIKAGVPRRRPGGRTYDRVTGVHMENYPVIDRKNIVHMYNVEKLSVETIAKTYGVTWRAARWNLIQAGVRIRRRLRGPQ